MRTQFKANRSYRNFELLICFVLKILIMYDLLNFYYRCPSPPPPPAQFQLHEMCLTNFRFRYVAVLVNLSKYIVMPCIGRLPSFIFLKHEKNR